MHVCPTPPCPPPQFCSSLLTQLLQGIMARVYETSVVLLLLTLLVLGMVWVASAMAGDDAASRQSLYGGCCCCCWGVLGSPLPQHQSPELGMRGPLEPLACDPAAVSLRRSLGVLPALPLLLHLALRRPASAA